MADNYAPLPSDYDVMKHLAPPTSKVDAQKYPPLPPNYVVPGQTIQPSLVKDVAMAPVSGTQRGVYGLPETAQGLNDIIESIPGRLVSGGIWAGEKVGVLPEGTSGKYEKSMEDIRREAAQRQEKYGEPDRMPTREEVTKSAESLGIPTAPAAQTAPGRIIEAGFEQIPSSLLMGPGTAAERAVIGATSGLAGQALAEPVRGTEYEPYAKIIGSLGGGLATATGASILAARGAEAVENRAKDIAGQVAREHMVPEGQIGPQAIGTAPETIPGVDLTTAQTLQAQGRQGAASRAEAFAQNVTGIKGAEQSPEVQGLRSQEEVSQEALGAGASKASESASKAAENAEVYVPDSFGITGVNPQGDASINVRSMVDSLERKLADQSSQAWQNPALQSAGLYKNKSLSPLIDYVNGLTEAKQQTFPSSLVNILNRLQSLEGSQIDFKELQDLRSAALRAARKSYASPEPMDSASVYGFADAIGDVMSNPQNVRFGNVRGEIEAWNDARAATKQYHDTFGDNFLGNIADNPNLSPELTLDKIYSGQSGINNLRALRETFGESADKDIQDWMIGKLTKNGSKFDVKPNDVEQFVADPKNAAIISEVPGLPDRLMNVAYRANESEAQGTMRQFSDRFSDVINKNNPKALVEFLDRNADMVQKVFSDPTQKQFVAALGDSARALQKIRPSQAVDTKTLQNLADNRMFTILYGRATGAISDAVAGELLGQVAEHTLNIAGSPTVGAVAGALGYGKGLTSKITDLMNGVVFGGTKDQAVKILQQAASDPELMTALLNRPNSNGYASLSNALQKISAKTALPATEIQSREQRASGGSVLDKKADALVNETMRNQKLNSNHTEHMLSMPDDAIVQALNIAKQVAA